MPTSAHPDVLLLLSLLKDLEEGTPHGLPLPMLTRPNERGWGIGGPRERYLPLLGSWAVTQGDASAALGGWAEDVEWEHRRQGPFSRSLAGQLRGRSLRPLRDQERDLQFLLKRVPQGSKASRRMVREMHRTSQEVQRRLDLLRRIGKLTRTAGPMSLMALALLPLLAGGRDGEA